MPQSRLFVSSVSRRDLARRRPGRSPIPAALAVLLALAVIAALAVLLVGNGTL